MSSDLSAVGHLRDACMRNDLAKVKRLFRHRLVDSANAAEVLEAARDPRIMLLLLENGAEPNVIPIKLVRSIDKLRLLVDFGYDVGAKGHLILEDYADDADTLDWLLDLGADINRTDERRTSDGQYLYTGATDTSLHVLNRVAARGNIKLFDHLVSRGADPHRSFALHCASKCKDPEVSVAMVSHLLDHHKLDVYANNEDLRNFFHDPPDSGTPLTNAIYRRNLAVVKELIRRGVDPNHRYHASEAIGYHNFEEGFLPALPILLEAGADADEALKSAIFSSHLEAAKICLDFGADPESGLQYAQTKHAEDEEREREDDEFHESLGYSENEDAEEERRIVREKRGAMVKLLENSRSASTGK
ncbi:hypothetical protein HII31_07955 [Pseudocercospora fuligena]|uniref:Ankyrin n=1 Tax=Pseudocercospora fuligena TaxID=685502 RepID=A0A8H6RGS8_9PEZI|nr:hypothetical protein HII31_07955 [Pseudocercospora fuligena]